MGVILMSDVDIRKLIDEAKQKSASLDAQDSVIVTPNGTVAVKRRKSAEFATESVPIDPSNVAVASDGQLIGMLVAQLIDIRARKRELDDQDAAIKAIMQDMVGELEYLALAEGEKPVISMKHESSVRLKTASVKEMLPIDEYPDLYSQVSSRPLRLMG
jgi:hypothetical protein